MHAHLNILTFPYRGCSSHACGRRTPLSVGRLRKVRLLLTGCQLLSAFGAWSQHTVSLLHPPAPPLLVTAPAAEHAAATLPFDLSGGMMLVQAAVDGRTGTFILDTGAPGIILNNRETSAGDTMTARGIGGAVHLGVTKVGHFSWGNIHLEHPRVYTLDIRHLEAACGRRLLGLIGFEAFRDQVLLIDYEGQVIRVFPDANTLSAGSSQPLRWIRFHLSGHLPVVKARVGGRTLYLGLDSGSEINGIDRNLLDALPEVTDATASEEWLTGLDNRPEPARSVTLPSLAIRQHHFPAMRYAALPPAALRTSTDCTLHGLLGFPFFRQHKIAIDYRRNRLCFLD
jgi:hypothetical protein